MLFKNENERRKAIDTLTNARHPNLSWAKLAKADDAEFSGLMEQAAKTRAELGAMPTEELHRQYLETLRQQEEVRRKYEELRAEIQEKGYSWNSAEAKQANLPFWVAMDQWEFDEAIALVCGRDPKRVKWSTLGSCVNVSAFARAYSDVRLLAQRSEGMGYGQYRVWRNSVFIWLTTPSVFSALPAEVRASAQALTFAIADTFPKVAAPVPAAAPTEAPAVAPEAPAKPEQAPDIEALKPVQRSKSQEDQIIAAIERRGLDPMRLPRPPLGNKPWPLREEIRAELKFTKVVMEKAWGRLRKDGKVGHEN